MRCLVLGIAVAVTSLMPVVGNADDQRIADFIKGRLQAEQKAGNLKGFNVDMRVEDGTVWFEGHVSRTAQEMTILRTAQAAGHLGVVKVVDDIEVRQGNAASDNPYKKVGYQRSVGTYQQPTPAYRAPAASAASAYQPAHAGSGRRPTTEPTFRKASVRRQVEDLQGVIGAPIPVADSGQFGGSQPLPFGPASSCSDCGSGGAPEFVDHGPAPAYGGPAPAYGGPAPAYGGPAPAYGGPTSYGPAPQQLPVPQGPAYGGGGASEAPGLPGYAWPSYTAHPNYGALSYPQQYSASAWPYIGPFYPYPQVPLGWRKVSLEWDDGWWMLDFHDK